MNLTLSCPGKTFFLGEYVALYGGPTLLLSTAPRFYLHIIHNDFPQGSILRGISPYSPSGKFLKQYPELLQKYGFEFRDPHTGKGGLGASSAQFLLFYIFYNYLKNNYQFCTELNVENFLQEYLRYAWNGEGLAPSGADLIAQYHGQITFFHRNQSEIKNITWQFNNLNFVLLRTGFKVPTHAHLKNIRTIPHELLGNIVLQAIDAFEQHQATLLIQAVNNYASELMNLGLVANQTQALLAKAQIELPIVAAKGCGALGGDIFMLLFEPMHKEKITHWAQQNKLIIVGDEQSLSDGVWEQ